MADEENKTEGPRKEAVVILNGSWFDRATGQTKSRGDTVEFTEKQARTFGLENLGFAGDVPEELAGKSIAEAEREEKLRAAASKADKSDDKDKKPVAGSTEGASKDAPKDAKK